MRGMKLHAVEACLFGAQGGFPEFVGKTGDAIRGELLKFRFKGAFQGACACRGAHGRAIVFRGLAPCMIQLHKNRSMIPMEGFRQAGQPREQGILRYRKLSGAGTAFRADESVLGDDKADVSPVGSFFIVAAEG